MNYEDFIQLNYILNNWDFLCATGYLMTLEQYENWYYTEMYRYEINHSQFPYW